MLKSMKQSWRSFASLAPGTRFHTSYVNHQRARHSKGNRLAVMAGGLFLILAGVIALVAPGPGILMIGLGIALIARESERLSRAMDRLEMSLRKLWRRFRPTPRTRR
jgi:hypothetical protein